jgi:2-keto-4-pentenoate hydratase/2-oxohepta-3-ene-1,7-dioic acid hydratase in catechol pathway
VKIGFYGEFHPCLVKEDGVVDIEEVTGGLPGGSPQLWLERLILDWETQRPRLEEAWQSGRVIPRDSVQLRSPVPRPGKVLNGQRNFKEGVEVDPPRPLSTFFKSPDAVIGDGEIIVLPKFRATIFNHESELCVVIGKPAKNIAIEEARNHIFGYTCGVDVSARAPEEGEAVLSGNYGKCFDTFLPLGPAITTADEIANPNNLAVKYSVNGVLRQNYNTNDIEHSVEFMIATLSHNMTLKPGDVIMVGTNHSYLGPLQDGDVGVVEIEGLGRMSNPVSDELKRTWDPNALRSPEALAQNRESMQGTASGGTWPFFPKTEGAPQPVR